MVNKITIDRATVEQALEALEARGVCMFTDDTVVDDAITALHQALEQPNEFHPDWDQIKPFHDRIAELETVAKQALAALNAALSDDRPYIEKSKQAITALRQALEQPAQQQEPVIDKSAATRIATALGWEPKREWVGLTMEDKKRILESDFGGSRLDCMDEAEKILKEKNT